MQHSKPACNKTATTPWYCNFFGRFATKLCSAASQMGELTLTRSVNNKKSTGFTDGFL